MKSIFLFLMIISFVTTKAQENFVCYVTSIKGDIRNANDKIKVGDKIFYNDIKNLTAYTKDGMVTFYSKNGTFRAYTKNAYTPHHKEGLFEFAAHLLKISGKSIPLSSRGSCNCVLAEECLSTDPEINERILIYDTLFFPEASDLKNYDSSFYFLQWKVGDKMYNKPLNTLKGNAYITINDLKYNGKYYNEDGDQKINLGLCKILDGKKMYSNITSLKLNIIPEIVLLDYYQTLKLAMNDLDEKEVYKTYYEDLYLYYGKPDQCRLKQLINYKY